MPLEQSHALCMPVCTQEHEGELLEIPDADTATPILPDTFTVQQVYCIRHLA